MPTIDIKDSKNQKVGSVDLPGEVFAYPFKEHLVHEAVRNYRAALRAGTHKTKVRGEVAGSGKKPFKQKGTGRARQGGARPPIGSRLDEVVVEYPVGHRRRRAEALPALVEKFRTNLACVFPAGQAALILDLCLDADRLDATPVNEFIDLMVV